MSNKEFTIPFNAPLTSLDTEKQTFGCRQNNPIYAGTTIYRMCARFAALTIYARNRQGHGKTVPETIGE